MPPDQPQSFPFVATILTLISCLVLIALGTWQLERLSWKQDVLAHLASEYKKTDIPIVDIGFVSSFAGGRYDFEMISLRGRFIHAHEILVRPRTYDGQPGYHLYTPLALSEGGTVLVNRGFLPLDRADPETRADSRAAGPVKVTGILRSPEPPALFVPENNPDTQGWYRVDMGDIRKTTGLNNLADNIVYAVTERPAPESLNRQALKWNPPNNHLGYAIFWYSLAGILLIIYYLRFWYGRVT